MPKRLTDTSKWNDPWYRRLSPALKLGFLYLLDGCNHAGIIDLDSDLADYQIGAAVDWESLVDGERVIRLECGKLWVVKFCQFQYCKGLKEDSQVHRSVIDELAKYNLISRLPQGFVNPCPRIKDKDKDKDKAKDTTKVTKGESEGDRFAEFWQEVPRKVGKEAAAKAYASAVQRLKKTQTDPHAHLLDRIKAFSQSDVAKGDYCPHPSTWLNQGRYDDDPAAWSSKATTRGSPADPRGNLALREKLLAELDA